MAGKQSVNKGWFSTPGRPGDRTLDQQLNGLDRLFMAARGKTVADTAQILGISPETVEGFIKQALRKLEASNKTHGVAKSIALGIIDL